jgi:hypothetical protein
MTNLELRNPTYEALKYYNQIMTLVDGKSLDLDNRLYEGLKQLLEDIPNVRIDVHCSQCKKTVKEGVFTYIDELNKNSEYLCNRCKNETTCIHCYRVEKRYNNQNTERKFYCLKKKCYVNPGDTCKIFKHWELATEKEILEVR